eukprot:1475554-Pyramimonas_sp.AAC.1
MFYATDNAAVCSGGHEQQLRSPAGNDADLWCSSGRELHGRSEITVAFVNSHLELEQASVQNPRYFIVGNHEADRPAACGAQLARLAEATRGKVKQVESTALAARMRILQSTLEATTAEE